MGNKEYYNIYPRIGGDNMSRKMIDRTGEENYNNEGTLMRIIKYRRVNDIFVEFQDEYKANVHTTYSSFKKGNVKNPFHKSVYSVGYIGIGKYIKIPSLKKPKICLR